MNPTNETPMDRRTALKWMLAAAASVPLAARLRGAPDPAPAAKGYGTDPDVTKIYQAGELWPLTLDPAQRRTATALCDIIIPADDSSPSASAVGVVSFLDEWISAPYPNHVKDRKKIVDGLAWIDAEAQRRFSKGFADLPEAGQTAICDDICYHRKARPEFAEAAAFFARYRDLTAGGFYTSPEGTKDLKYVGNVPLATFDGPPPEVLKKVGLA